MRSAAKWSIDAVLDRLGLSVGERSNDELFDSGTGLSLIPLGDILHSWLVMLAFPPGFDH